MRARANHLLGLKFGVPAHVMEIILIGVDKYYLSGLQHDIISIITPSVNAIHDSLIVYRLCFTVSLT